MARYNKRLAPVDACFPDARDPKRARFDNPPLPDAQSTLPESLHSGYSAHYASVGVHSSGKGLAHHVASHMPSEDGRDRDSSQADEESEQRTKLTPVIQTRLEDIQRYTNGLSEHFCEMVIQELDGYHGAKAHNTTMAADIVEHCAKLARIGRSDLRHEKHVALKAFEMCFPGGRGEPIMSLASEGGAGEGDGGTSVDTDVYRDAVPVRADIDSAQLRDASIRTLQPHPYDQSFTSRSYSHQSQTIRYDFERDLPPRRSPVGVQSSSTVSRAEHARSTADTLKSGSRKEGQRRPGALLLTDLLNP